MSLKHSINIDIDLHNNERVHVKEKIVLSNKNVYTLMFTLSENTVVKDLTGIDSAFIVMKTPSGETKRLGLTIVEVAEGTMKYEMPDPSTVFEGKGKYVCNLELKNSTESSELHAKGFIVYTTGAFA